ALLSRRLPRSTLFPYTTLFRSSGVVVKIPSLAERKDEILPLARLLAVRAAKERNKPAPVLAPETEHALVAHAWPGNVRELGHVRSEEHTSELQSLTNLLCRLLL